MRGYREEEMMVGGSGVSSSVPSATVMMPRVSSRPKEILFWWWGVWGTWRHGWVLSRMRRSLMTLEDVDDVYRYVFRSVRLSRLTTKNEKEYGSLLTALDVRAGYGSNPTVGVPGAARGLFPLQQFCGVLEEFLKVRRSRCMMCSYEPEPASLDNTHPLGWHILFRMSQMLLPLTRAYGQDSEYVYSVLKKVEGLLVQYGEDHPFPNATEIPLHYQRCVHVRDVLRRQLDQVLYPSKPFSSPVMAYMSASREQLYGEYSPGVLTTVGQSGGVGPNQVGGGVDVLSTVGALSPVPLVAAGTMLPALPSLPELAGGVGHVVSHGVGEMVEGVEEMASQVGHGVGQVASQVGHGVEQVAGQVGHGVGQVLSPMVHGVGKVSGKVVQGVVPVVGQVSHGVQQVVGRVEGGVGQVVSVVEGAVNEFGQGVQDAANHVGPNVGFAVERVGEGVHQTVHGVHSTVNGAVNMAGGVVYGAGGMVVDGASTLMTVVVDSAVATGMETAVEQAVQGIETALSS